MLPNVIIKHSSNIQNYKRISPILSRNFSLQIEANKPKTFSNQHIIPRLPIPTLQETAKRYKKSLLPILKPEDYSRAANAVDDFIKAGGLGEVLQTRLHKLDKIEKVQLKQIICLINYINSILLSINSFYLIMQYSWLENIWLNKAYLEWRDPSLINVNWWCEFKDHPNGILKQALPKGKVTDFQINRAAGFISSLLSYNDAINKYIE
jgi:carnitine O-acetyltransferase